jgi:hypothetical protein
VYSLLDCKTRGHITEGIMAEMEGHARGSRRGPPPGLRGRGDPGSRAEYLGRVQCLIGWVAGGSNLGMLHRAVVGSRRSSDG